MSDWLKSVLPEKPAKRAVSLAALAAAGCGGIYFVAQSGLLEGSDSFPVKPWQVLTLASWAGNAAAVAAGGRLDSSMGGESAESQEPALPAVRFFSPAGWAFTIWAPIMQGEISLALYQALPFSSVRSSFGWLSKLSPWLGSAFLLQSCWCLSFREWARDSGLLWFPAVLLGGTATCLGGAHGVLRGALASGAMSSFQYSMVHIPISLHFAWVSCASLVNANAYLALLPKISEKALLRFSLASITAATFLAASVTCSSRDPLYAGVVSWALSAIASEGGWKMMKGVVGESSLKCQQSTARVGAGVCMLVALASPFISNVS